jgi:hypothetical protein
MPIHSSLRPNSALAGHVRAGLGALQSSDKEFIEPDIRADFSESIDIDRAFQASHSDDNRWDYLLGHEAQGVVVAFEPHTGASTRAVGEVIAKKAAAVGQLRGHLKPNAKVVSWYWAASKAEFVPFDKQLLRLQQAGIRFVGKKLLRKHLPK